MSTTKIYLDPEKTTSLEPYEGDENHRSSISSFAVPESVTIDFPMMNGERGVRLRFEYPGGPYVGVPEPLDDLQPPITVMSSRVTKAILELTFTSSLEDVIKRMQGRSKDNMAIAKRFSYLMTVNILLAWAPEIAIGTVPSA